MARRTWQALTVLLFVPLGGCVGGNPLVHSQSIRINSTPAGAIATSEYGDSCRTPCNLRLRTSRGGHVRVARDGYDPVDVFVGTRPDSFRRGLIAANAAAHAVDPDPLLIGVDLLLLSRDWRGATRRLNANHVSVDLPVASGPRINVDQEVAALPPLQDGPGVVRLSQAQVQAILGTPIAERRLSGVGGSAAPRRMASER